MRLRVEVEWKGTPWRRRVLVRNLAVVDAIFGVLCALCYIVKICIPDLEPEFPAYTVGEQVNTTVALVFLMAANLVQTLYATRLWYIVTRDEPDRDPATSFEAAKTWYDFSELGYLFVIVKCIITISYIFKVAPTPWVLLLTVVTTPEVIFKMVMLVTIFGFMKDLKQSLKFLPKFRFVPIIEQEQGVPSKGDIEDQRASFYEKYDIIDINANQKLLP